MAHMGDRRDAYKILVRKPDGNSSLGRPRLTWDNNINLGLQGMGLGTLDWIELAQDRERWQILLVW